MTLEEGSVVADLLAQEDLSNVQVSRVSWAESSVLQEDGVLNSGDIIRIENLTSEWTVQKRNIKWANNCCEDDECCDEDDCEDEEKKELKVPEPIDWVVWGIIKVARIIKEDSYQVPDGSTLATLYKLTGVPFTQKARVNGEEKRFSYVIQHWDIVEIQA